MHSRINMIGPRPEKDVKEKSKGKTFFKIEKRHATASDGGVKKGGVRAVEERVKGNLGWEL